jgi:hypothetical protein
LHGDGSASRIFFDAGIAINPPERRGIYADPIPFQIDFANYGAVTGTGVVVTMTLAPSLTYHADNAPATPIIDGQNVVWALDDLLPWEQGTFDVAVNISPAATFGQAYPITATIGVAEVETTQANNGDLAQIIAGRALYIPAMLAPE